MLHYLLDFLFSILGGFCGSTAWWFYWPKVHKKFRKIEDKDAGLRAYQEHKDARR